MVLQKLNDLGFANAELLKEGPDFSLVRVRTSKGWTYERFQDQAAVEAWANHHKPEVTNVD